MGAVSCLVVGAVSCLGGRFELAPCCCSVNAYIVSKRAGNARLISCHLVTRCDARVLTDTHRCAPSSYCVTPCNQSLIVVSGAWAAVQRSLPAKHSQMFGMHVAPDGWCFSPLHPASVASVVAARLRTPAPQTGIWPRHLFPAQS